MARGGVFRGLVGFCLLAAAGLRPAAAQADEPTPLGLEQALALAERQNPELLAAREGAAAQAARGDAAKRASWPRLSASADWFRTDNPARVFGAKLNRGEFTAEDFAVERLNHPDALSHLTTSISLDVPVDAFGKIRARARGESALGRAASAEAEEAALAVRLAVVEAYRRVGLARAALGVTARALDGARAREKDIEARVEEGAALRADLLRARSRRRQREADLAERRGDLEIALAALGRVLGAPAGARYDATEVAGEPGGALEDEAAWLARALSRRPVLLGARERVAAAEWAARGERRGILPDLVAYGQVQDDRGALSRGEASGTLGISLRWAPLDPSRGKRVAAATAEVRAAQAQDRAAEEQVRLEVEIAWRHVEASRARYAAASGGAEEGREALRVTAERRQEGMATLTDELETEAASLQAELEEVKAAAEAALADAALRRAAGEL